MAERKFLMVRVKETRFEPPSLTLSEVACRCGVHPDLIDRFMQLGLIDPADWGVGGEAYFHEEVIPTIRRILRLRNQLGVNYIGVGVILELMARIEFLEARILELERRLYSD